MTRAYSLLHVKSVDAEKRILRGTATTPEPDRMGDIIEPLGVSFKNPLPLLLYHDSKRPVGWTKFDKPTAKGLDFEAKIAVIDEPGVLRDRVEEAWQSVKAGLISGVSIGFRPLEQSYLDETDSFHFLRTEVMELSLVTIPANASATIHTVKQYDTADPPAATGPHLPGVSGASTVVRLPKAPPRMKTYADQISAFEAKRAASTARMDEIQTKASTEGRSKDDAEKEEFQTLQRDVETCDSELVDLRKMEQLALTKATPIAPLTGPAASDLRGGPAPVITVKANVPKGTAFARMVMAMAVGHGDSYKTLQHAKQWKESTPEVEHMIEHMWRTKAAVAVGTTTDATWAGPLVVTTPLNEFLELLRPRTLLGRIPGLRNVPFNVSVPTQTTGGTYGWVGQNKPKPVTKADYSSVTVGFAKAAGIIVISEELAMLSTPSAEGLVREEMIAGMGQFLDLQFQDPAVAAVTNVSPASITNGAPTAAASGATAANAKADLAARIAVFTAAGIPLEGSVWLMNDSNAFGLAMSMNALGQPMFPGVTGQGGTLFGMPVIVSNSLSTRVVLMHAPSILYADEGGVRIDVSREASVQMDSAPTDTVDATTVYLSLWQRNLIGLKAERFITWVRARTNSVTYITAAAYTGA